MVDHADGGAWVGAKLLAVQTWTELLRVIEAHLPPWRATEPHPLFLTDAAHKVEVLAMSASGGTDVVAVTSAGDRQMCTSLGFERGDVFDGWIQLSPDGSDSWLARVLTVAARHAAQLQLATISLGRPIDGWFE